MCLCNNAILTVTVSISSQTGFKVLHKRHYQFVNGYRPCKNNYWHPWRLWLGLRVESGPVCCWHSHFLTQQTFRSYYPRTGGCTCRCSIWTTAHKTPDSENEPIIEYLWFLLRNGFYCLVYSLVFPDWWDRIRSSPSRSNLSNSSDEQVSIVTCNSANEHGRWRPCWAKTYLQLN